jgi:hypothetical protein
MGTTKRRIEELMEPQFPECEGRLFSFLQRITASPGLIRDEALWNEANWLYDDMCSQFLKERDAEDYEAPF